MLHLHGEAFVAENVDIGPGVSIGSGTTVWNYTRIRNDVTIGTNCNIASFVYVDSHVTIGNGVKVQNGCQLYKGVEVEDDVFIGPNVTFTNVRTPRAFVDRKDEFEKTILRKGCSIGAGCVIRCGVEIGEYAMVGSGTVVTSDVKPHTLVYTDREVKAVAFVCECGEMLRELEGYTLSCDRCYTQWELLDQVRGIKKIGVVK